MVDAAVDTSPRDGVFVAGAGGAVGRRLCRLLVGDGWHVTGTTRSTERAPALRAIGVVPVVVDVFDEERLRGVADAARRALMQGEAGVYNVAEEDGTVSSRKAIRELGWNPAFRIAEAKEEGVG